MVSLWQVDRLRESTLRDLEEAELRLGFSLPKLKQELKSMSGDLLIEFFSVMESYGSMADSERKVAHKILPLEDFMKFARKRYGSRPRRKKE